MSGDAKDDGPRDAAGPGKGGSPAPVIRAAGGLLWRETGTGAEVALVYRTRHGGGWSLPKGKLQPGESWEQAALREVREETGCAARIIGFADAIAYLADGTPKIVVFWHMAPVGECVFRSSDEVDRVAWFDPRAAANEARYEKERRLLTEVERPR